MGLAEQISVGANLARSTQTFATSNTLSSGSASLGITYGILSISTTQPCRLRLYDNLTSLNDAGEAARAFGNTSISSSIALIGDFTMSLANTTFTVDPVVYATIENTASAWTYYRVNEAVTAPTISLITYTLEDPTKKSVVGTAYYEENRRPLPSFSASIAPGEIVSGTISSFTYTIPKTYLFVSASMTGSVPSRLRLYSTSASLYDSVEKARSFTTEASESAKLLVDLILTGSETTYFVPKIVGANLQNMGNDLGKIKTSTTLIAGKNEVYYLLENAATTGGASPITASVHVYSLED